jgi:hypothetical protein
VVRYVELLCLSSLCVVPLFSAIFPISLAPFFLSPEFKILLYNEYIAKGLTPVVEETQSGILREYSDANVPTVQRDEAASRELDLDDYDDAQPDFTPQPSFSSSSNNVKVSNSVVNEFWKMVISIFFLTWMKKSDQTKKLENGGGKSASSSVDSDSDSVPVMSFSPEK